MKLKITILLSSILLFTSCALKPITSDYTFIKTDLDKVDFEKLGNGTVLLYNGADIFNKIDNTARLNIWIDNKPLGQLRPNEYVIINLKEGKYRFKVLHLDLVKMTSEHSVTIDNITKIIKIKPTLTSNSLSITNIVPSNFNKMKPAQKR